MSDKIKIYVNNDLDIALARMQARQLARQLGFGPTDQVRISLATSELARLLAWKPDRSGTIVLSTTTRHTQQGLQVTCLIKAEWLNKTDLERNIRPFVDEAIIARAGDKYNRLTLIKWLI